MEGNIGGIIWNAIAAFVEVSMENPPKKIRIVSQPGMEPGTFHVGSRNERPLLLSVILLTEWWDFSICRTKFTALFLFEIRSLDFHTVRAMKGTNHSQTGVFFWHLLMTELQRAKTVQSAEDLHVSLSLLYIK
jgi:hypothetical protein